MDTNRTHISWLSWCITCLIPLACFVQGEFRCLEGHHLFREECVLKVDTRMPWKQARGLCESRNASLLTIHDQDKNDFIRRMELCNREHCWLDLKRRDLAAPFVWQHTGAQVDYANWFLTQPNGGQERCVSMSYDLWVSGYCNFQLAYICEKPESSGCDAEEWQVFSGSCYKKVTQLETWMDARQACQNDMADLVVIETEKEDVYLSDAYEGGGQGFWIGLNLNLAYDWVWLDQTDSQLDYSNLYSSTNETLPTQRDYNCVMLYTDAASLGKWANQNCDQAFGYICESPSYVDSWIEHRGKFYKFIPEAGGSWRDARYACREFSDGADLLVIDNREEQNFITANIVGYANSPGFWTGINSLGDVDRFVGLDEDIELLYTNWDCGEPDYIDEELCVTATVPGYFEDLGLNHVAYGDELKYPGATPLYWNDVECKGMNFPVCQSPAEGEPTFHDFHYENNIYVYVRGNFTGEEGMMYCTDHFGAYATVVTFDTYEEEVAIRRQLGARYKTLEDRLEFWFLDRDTNLDENVCFKAILYREPFPWISTELQDCNGRLDLLCEKHLEPSEDRPDFGYGRSVYKVMSGRVSLHDAELTCARTLPGGGKLLDIQSRDEFQVINRELPIRHRGRELQYWLYGSIDDAFVYNNIDRMPDAGEDCLMLSLPSFPEVEETDELLIVPTSCDGLKYFVCEQEFF